MQELNSKALVYLPQFPLSRKTCQLHFNPFSHDSQWSPHSCSCEKCLEVTAFLEAGSEGNYTWGKFSLLSSLHPSLWQLPSQGLCKTMVRILRNENKIFCHRVEHTDNHYKFNFRVGYCIFSSQCKISFYKRDRNAQQKQRW